MESGEFTPEKRSKFLETLSGTCNVSRSCEEVGVSRTLVYRLRREDPVFATQWDDAKKIAIEALEDEMHRRAYEGYELITKAGVIKGYSDTLAIFLAKAHNPEKYSDRIRNEISGPGGAPLGMTEEQIAAKLAGIGQAALMRKQQETAEVQQDGEDDYSDIV